MKKNAESLLHMRQLICLSYAVCISFLMKHNLSVFHKLDVEAIIDQIKQQHVEQYSSTTTSPSLVVYKMLQPEYKYAEYLSVVRCFPNRRLLSRFRCG